MDSRQKTLLVIGGGAAGLFCAVNAARLDPSLKVIVTEKTSKLLSKVKVSGGGRCNVTHACFSISEMAKKYPRGSNFVKKTFHRWFTTDTIQWFAERGVPLKEEADGRMFPVTNSSQTVIDCLMTEVNKWGVEIWMKAEVANIYKLENIGQQEGSEPHSPATTSKFRVQLADSRMLNADYICIASGGYPKSAQFEWIRQLGHTVEDPVPSLFTFNIPGDPITLLMGVSVPQVQVKIPGTKLVEKGPLLITHWGLSGPVILRLSAWGARELAAGNPSGPGAMEGYHFTILINWLPAFSEQSLKERLQQLRYELAPQKIAGKSPFGLPQRLWDHLLTQSGIDSGLRWADLPVKAQNLLVKNCSLQELKVKGKTTFKEEFVTAGGVRLAETNPLTMQSRIVDGLFFAGEILDVDGITGGFNFQHAWTSGWIAAHLGKPTP